MVDNRKNKFNNYVYFTICEVALSLFAKTKYTTFIGYCKGMKTAMVSGDYTYANSKHIAAIMERLELIYSLGDKLSGEYVVSFFCDDKYLIFEEPVRLTNEYFKKALN